MKIISAICAPLCGRISPRYSVAVARYGASSTKSPTNCDTSAESLSNTL
ncbi:MAG: DUF6783 domain-containing protein [Ruminococcus sp.]